MCIEWRAIYQWENVMPDHQCYEHKVKSCAVKVANPDRDCGRYEIIHQTMLRPCPICLLDSLKRPNDDVFRQFLAVEAQFAIVYGDECRTAADHLFNYYSLHKESAKMEKTSWVHTIPKAQDVQDCITEFSEAPSYAITIDQALKEPMGCESAYHINIRLLTFLLFERLRELWGKPPLAEDDKEHSAGDKNKKNDHGAEEHGEMLEVEDVTAFWASGTMIDHVNFYLGVQSTLVTAERELWFYTYEVNPRLYRRISDGIWSHFGSVWRRVLYISEVVTLSDLDANHRQCGICLEEYTNESEIFKLPCGHAWDKECLRKWLESDWERKGYNPNLLEEEEEEGEEGFEEDEEFEDDDPEYSGDEDEADGREEDENEEEFEDEVLHNGQNPEDVEETVETHLPLKVCSLCNKDFGISGPNCGPFTKIFLETLFAGEDIDAHAVEIREELKRHLTPGWSDISVEQLFTPDDGDA
ncbi:hypothetical protein HYALB_00011703 [Hymenoscyphus albidus]|uniref:RING-type domain-containing protein n=1 Tax=Hymenoscyphus albidus TaxID=595503 RepID=A0A9N9LL15_9HELO|nr:hypothetical protein HYALB_00011703 [Hymenoscyphus albidus]